MVTKLQPILFVTDLPSERQFYVDLGFEASHEGEGFVAMSAGDSVLFGLQARNDADPEQLARQVTWQFGVEAIEPIHRRCQEQGIEVIAPPALQDQGQWTLRVRSPNGFEVTFEGPAEKAPPAVRLARMNPDEYDAWLARTVPEYAEEKVAAGNYHPSDALERAAEEFRQLLPQGVDTPGQHLFTIVDEALGAAVGRIWFAEIQRGPRLEAFVYDLAVDEAYRRRGYARAAMLALEDEVRRLGIERIGLHVFGYNRGARALYRRLGYEETNVNMAKTIPATTSF